MIKVRLWSAILEVPPMNTVIFYSENAVIKFRKKEVKERLIVPESEYNPDEITQLLKLIST